MAATKKMVIRVILDGSNDIRYTVPQTKANLAKLTEAFGDPHVIVPRNVWGRNGMPADVRKERASAKKTASKPKVKPAKTAAKRTTKPAVKPATVTA